MKKLIIALAGVSALLGASAASAQPYRDNWDQRGSHDRAWYDRDRHDRDWRDRDWRDRGWRDDWRWRRYHYGRPFYGYGHQVCSWRYGERVCWYQR